MKKNIKKGSLCRTIICAALIASFMLTAYGCGSSSRMDESITAGAPDGIKSTTAGTAADGYEAFDGGDDGLTEAAAEYGAMDVAKSVADTNGGDAPGTPETIDEVPEKELPAAGQLTAGQWNDNENRGFFTNLVNSGTIAFPSFGLDPTNRIAITVNDKDGKPAANASVRLLDSAGKVIFESVTNKEGIAYLFEHTAGAGVSAEVEILGNKQTFELPAVNGGGQSGDKKTSDRELTVTFDGSGTLYKNMDVMFIVDATGSMFDEMLFLQSEFTEITKEIGTKDTRWSVNFYRDEGDDYVTKCSPFSTDIKDIQKNLNKEEADGGGDYPEAVAQVLTETMFADDWSSDSVKLAFLIFDAPPHEGKEAELQAAIEEAARKGIHLIPVVSSDSDRDTELFGRAAAIMTDGQYVFLTDDSGIGNSHSEPIIGSYEVRPLYDIIIDIINGYKQ